MSQVIDDEDHVMYGMSHRRAGQMIGKILESPPEDIYPMKRKKDVAEYVEERAMNDKLDDDVRLTFIDRSLKMQAMNMEFQKMQLQVELAVIKMDSEGASEGKGEQQVILVLPSNGSEVQSG